ncbi:MAG: nucleotidyl transferase AbiEii/AbiGii toxin family protein [Micrococcales bacterium]|nr:nucleotidyl transferase AbiEii/AbiGii toxin family protein [Micrococcales bacterium]MCL2667991.1 nucleotidyl transferase AbiEii/AbiGii toxin family protein [Micrococcales bacterium]
MITEGHLVRHYQGARGARDAALLDIAQDHALHLLDAAGLFDRGLVFKGGTALRKYRAGNAGRFSTDLDFAAPGDALALDALAALDGTAIDGFSFQVTGLGAEGRRGDLHVGTPFGSPNLGAKIELARHPLSLATHCLEPVPMPIHRTYSIEVPTVPVIRREEAAAEKLARFRRVCLVRDLYDLQWFATHSVMDADLVRRLWVLKTYRDVVVDHRGDRPFHPDDVLCSRKAAGLAHEDIGYLTQPVRIDRWLAIVRSRYAFLADLRSDEAQWCAANPRDLHAVTTELAALSTR